MTPLTSPNDQQAWMLLMKEKQSSQDWLAEQKRASPKTALNGAITKPCISDNPQAHPKHYNMGRYEVIDVIEDWGLGFNLGNVVKYVARADHKGVPTSDLYKALFYLNRELAHRERNAT